MYKIVAERRAWWPVVWRGVSEDGEIIENKISMRFMLHKVDQSISIMGKAHEIETKARSAFVAGEDFKASKLFTEGVQLFACDWRGVAVDDGTPEGKALDWNDANLATLMNEPGLFDQVMEAYKACQRAAPAISQGN